MIKVKKYLLSRNHKDYKWTEAFKTYEEYKSYIIKNLQSREILDKIQEFYGLKDLDSIKINKNDSILGMKIAKCQILEIPKWVRKFKLQIPQNINVYIYGEKSYVNENWELVVEAEVKCSFDNIIRLVPRAGVDPDSDDLKSSDIFMKITF